MGKSNRRASDSRTAVGIVLLTGQLQGIGDEGSREWGRRWPKSTGEVAEKPLRISLRKISSTTEYKAVRVVKQ